MTEDGLCLKRFRGSFGMQSIHKLKFPTTRRPAAEERASLKHPLLIGLKGPRMIASQIPSKRKVNTVDKLKMLDGQWRRNESWHLPTMSSI